jgi:hypothetical protein
MTAKTKKKTVVPEQFFITANAYCLLHYATGYTAGPTPRKLVMQASELWVFPVLFTSPGYGVVGEVGLVAVDASSGEVVGSTPRHEVIAAATQLREANRDELEAAFLRARTS